VWYYDFENDAGIVEQGDDMAVMEPLIACLAQWGDNLILAFAEKMAELLYLLDTKEIAAGAYKNEEYFSGDEFLYIRCTALVNGKPKKKIKKRFGI